MFLAANHFLPNSLKRPIIESALFKTLENSTFVCAGNYNFGSFCRFVVGADDFRFGNGQFIVASLYEIHFPRGGGETILLGTVFWPLIWFIAAIAAAFLWQRKTLSSVALSQNAA
jgi:hypothetical protein